jgi:uncharacterized protein YbdZ (MbtH family)
LSLHPRRNASVAIWSTTSGIPMSWEQTCADVLAQKKRLYRREDNYSLWDNRKMSH